MAQDPNNIAATSSSLPTQSITLLTPQSPVLIPLASIDAINTESLSVTLNYGFQLGATTLLLLVTLVVTPPRKLLRAPSVLHLAALAACILRTALLEAFFLSPLNHFYPFWSGDFSSVSAVHLHRSIAGTCSSVLLVLVLEAALMHQAWTMVSLWASPVRAALVAASALVSLLTVGWRLAFAVVQSRATLALDSARDLAWVVDGALVLNCLSICWYCALFNVKLVVHLFANRGILRSAASASSREKRVLTPMEVLVVTNGVLMIVPVIFAALEWARLPNFESASLTHTSIALILPLGTLAAQQMTHGGGGYHHGGGGHNHGGGGYHRGESHNRSTTPPCSCSCSSTREKLGLATPPSSCKFPSVSTTCGSASATTPSSPNHGLVPSRGGDGSAPGTRRPAAKTLDHFDLELQKIDSAGALADQVRVDLDLEQVETRI